MLTVTAGSPDVVFSSTIYANGLEEYAVPQVLLGLSHLVT